MINIGGLLFLLITHYLCGRGLLQLFRLQLKPLQSFCLSMINGVAIASFVPCFAQLLKFPIITSTITGGLLITTALFCIPLAIHVIKNYRTFTAPKLTLPQIYELPFFFVFVILLGVSAWRCFYYPPIASDMLSGPELLAKYAVRDKNMISSVFHIDLQAERFGLSNIFKSPFITGLQIDYKLLVQPFGQMWLTVLVLSLVTLLYDIVRERVHPIIAGTLLVIFIVVPELYAYTFMILYDYPTMVYFFCGYFFLARYIQNEKFNELMFAGYLLGMSTYIRTEGLVIVLMIVPLLAFYLYKKKEPLVSGIIKVGLFSVISFVFYLICMKLFVKNFVPISFEVGKQLNPNIKDIGLFFDRLKSISSDLIFSPAGEAYYGPFFYIFLFVLFIDIIWQRKFNREAVAALYGIVVVYVGLTVIGHIFGFVIQNSTKRGLFRLLPLAIWYMSNSALLLRISNFIKNWEYAKNDPKPALAATPVRKPDAAPSAPVAPRPAPAKNKKK